MFGLIARNAQVNRLLDINHLFDDDGLRVYELWWWVIADVNLAVKAGLSQRDGDADIRSGDRRGGKHKK